MERLSILYASALFSLALEQNAVDEYRSQASVMLCTLQEPDVKRVLIHPRVTISEKHTLFRNAFEGMINSSMLGFLFLVTEKNREAYLLPALSQLIDNIDRYNNKIKANVLSAAPYNNEQTRALEAMLSKKLDKQVEVDLKVDPSVIGGPYIYADGYYIDWTVKKRLRDLTRSLKEGCGA